MDESRRRGSERPASIHHARPQQANLAILPPASLTQATLTITRHRILDTALSMSSDERSPKRQRLSSYSPASTPTETKPDTTPFVQHPNTPPPSVHMSPSWPSQPLPGLSGGGGGGVNFPTPPSPAAGYQSQAQSIAQSLGSEGGSARQTPAADGETSDVEMREEKAGSGDGDVDVRMDDGEHRRSDHERTEGEDAVAPLPSAVGLLKLPSERKCHSRSLLT